MVDIEKKKEQEKMLLKQMIEIYCRKKHNCKDVLCDECQELLNYANSKIEKCPFMETKTFCSNCKVHCYEKDMREKIKMVMRFSGPRIIFHYPILVIKHAILSLYKKLK